MEIQTKVRKIAMKSTKKAQEIDAEQLSNRAKNRLEALGWPTKSEFCSMQMQSIFKVRGLGMQTFQELCEWSGRDDQEDERTLNGQPRKRTPNTEIERLSKKLDFLRQQSRVAERKLRQLKIVDAKLNRDNATAKAEENRRETEEKQRLRVLLAESMKANGSTAREILITIGISQERLGQIKRKLERKGVI